jgi:hypothetical protein
MNLTSIIGIIKHYLKVDQRVASINVDDVYELWNRTNSSKQYMSAVVDFVSSNYNADYVDYNFIIYVGSVINEQQNNIYPLFSVADSVIQQMLHKIDVDTNELNLVIPNVITPFRQKFEDVIAGCYCQFTIRVSADIIC